MDSIRAAGPLSTSAYNTGNTIISRQETNDVSTPQDGFVRTSRDDASQSMNQLRDFSLSAGVRDAIQTTPNIPPAPPLTPAPTIEAAPPIPPAPDLGPAPSIPASTALGTTQPLSAPITSVVSGTSSAPAPSQANGSVTSSCIHNRDGDVQATSAGEICCSSISVSTSYLLEAGEAAGLSAAAGAAIGAAGYAVCSVGYAAVGAAMIHEGIKEHDPEAIIGGAGNVFDSISNGASVAEIATAGAELGSVGSAIGSVASKIATPFGLASAVVGFGLGTKELIEGIKEHDKTVIASGALSMAFGVATAAASFVGGVPMLITSGAILLAKCGVAAKQVHDARVQARLQAQANIQPQPPTPQSSSNSTTPSGTV